MSLMVLHIVTAVLFTCISRRMAIANILVDYYWREYNNGMIPDDAVPGGYDNYNRTTYIGQAFSKKYGIIPGTIYPRIETIVVPMKGAQILDSNVKILCSPSAFPFNWIPVTANESHVKMTEKHLVLGGVQDNYILNIGRVAFGGEVLIGKIVTDYEEENYASLWFVSRDNEHTVNFYEALTYDPKLNILINTITQLPNISLWDDKGEKNISQV